MKKKKMETKKRIIKDIPFQATSNNTKQDRVLKVKSFQAEHCSISAFVYPCAGFY